MPMYEYQCPTHGHFEVRQRISEAPLQTCPTPDCGQPVTRLISSTSFALKGGGWGSDLYSSSGGGKHETKPVASEPKAAEGCGGGACGTGACPAVAQA